MMMVPQAIRAESLAARPRYAMVAATVLGACLLWVYWPTLVELARLWTADPKYSHGYVIPVFVIALIWHLWRGERPTAPPTPWLGLTVLMGGLLLRGAGAFFYSPWLMAFSLLPLVAGIILCIGGVTAWRQTWPAIGFLVFMLPLPYRIESAVAQPLQSGATMASAYVLQVLGFPAYAEGNIIRVRDERVNVAEACNGLSMIMMFAALAAAVAVLSRRPVSDKVTILLSAVPIALVCNIVRIVTSAVCYVSIGHSVGDLLPFTRGLSLPNGTAIDGIDLHDVGGYLMVPLALVLLWLELRLIDWLLIIRRPAIERPRPQRQREGLHRLGGMLAKPAAISSSRL
jgi:exosortase